MVLLLETLTDDSKIIRKTQDEKKWLYQDCLSLSKAVFVETFGIFFVGFLYMVNKPLL
jgi:hypothetical protein